MEQEKPLEKPICYENFDLSIDKKRRRGYRVRLLQSPAGEGWAGFRPPFASDELDRLLAAYCSGYRDIRAIGNSPPKSLEDIGRRLFRSLFAGVIRSRWESSLKDGKPLRIRLRLTAVPELEGWPWELLYDPERRIYLSVSRSTPVVRYLEVGVGAAPLKVNAPVRILVVAANPSGRSPLNVEQEWGKVEHALAPVRSGGRLILERLDPPTPAALGEKLKQSYHILHFIGHGGLFKEQGTVELETEDHQPAPLTGQALANILVDQKDLRLVVLNSCDGARNPSSDPFSGVAQALVKSGLPTVIAMRSRISDSAAIAWARTFYKALSSGDPVDAALASARWNVLASNSGIDWSIPVLYMRSLDGHIFDVTSPTPSEPVDETEGPPNGQSKINRPKRWWIWVALSLLSPPLGLAIWRWATQGPPVVATDPGCPSPPGLDMPFARIPAGDFSMGKARSKDARPEHNVRISRPFCIGKFEVTQRQWKKIMGDSPSRHQDDDRPVEGVSWDDAQKFLSELNQKDPTGHYRLPTEAEWEYAAFSGGGSPDPGSAQVRKLRRLARFL